MSKEADREQFPSVTSGISSLVHARRHCVADQFLSWYSRGTNIIRKGSKLKSGECNLFDLTPIDKGHWSGHNKYKYWYNSGGSLDSSSKVEARGH